MWGQVLPPLTLVTVGAHRKLGLPSRKRVPVPGLHLPCTCLEASSLSLICWRCRPGQTGDNKGRGPLSRLERSS